MSVAELRRPGESDAAFIRQAKQIVHDLLTPNPVVYWADFLASITLAYTALVVYLNAPLFSATQILSLCTAGFLLYRASVFTHELAHMPPSRFRLFRAVWNLLFGIPFLMPSFLYTDHRVHHINQTYGTDGDGEYYPFAHDSVRKLVLNLLVLFLIPALLVIRFGVLTPLSLLSPTIRRWVWEKASSLGTLNPAYCRAAPDADERNAALVQQAGCFLFLAAFFGLMAAGVLSWWVLVKIYFVYLFANVANTLRVYAAHRYVSRGEPVSFVDQMLDSTTIPGGPWSALWAPLGMRYHALHHLFPTMPYHTMGRAHHRLMRDLPADSPYHATLRRSMPGAILMLLKEVRRHQRRPLSAIGRSVPH
jgi:fatty acid desaturase